VVAGTVGGIAILALLAWHLRSESCLGWAVHTMNPVVQRWRRVMRAGVRARAGEGPVREWWRAVLQLYCPGWAGGRGTARHVATRIPRG
jgi:hypothetical protein